MTPVGCHIDYRNPSVLTQWTCLCFRRGGKLGYGEYNGGGSWGIRVERDRIHVRIELQVRLMKRQTSRRRRRCRRVVFDIDPG